MWSVIYSIIIYFGGHCQVVLGTSGAVRCGAAGRIPAGLLRPASPVLRTASQLICAFGGKSREREWMLEKAALQRLC